MEPKKRGVRSFFFALDGFLSIFSSAIGGIDRENDERRGFRAVVWLRFKELPDADAARVSRTEALLMSCRQYVSSWFTDGIEYLAIGRCVRTFVMISELGRRSVRIDRFVSSL